MVALALFAIPDGATVLAGGGLVLLIISLTWLEVVLHACVRATVEAAWLLQPTPSGGDRLRPASLRYPLLASACALLLAVGGASLVSDGSTIAALSGAACAIAVSAWPFLRILAATRHPEPSA